MSIFMKYKGGAIKGSGGDDAHKDWISLTSCSWSLSRTISAPVGDTAKRETSAPLVGEIAVGKDLDASSTKLWKESLTGTGVDCQIDFCTTDGIYLTLTLYKTMISSYSLSCGSEKPTETLALNFTKIDFTNFPPDSEGKPGTADPDSYDLSTIKQKK